MSFRRHIFLSYSSVEADFALRLAADLKNKGVRLWMDRFDLQVGDDWRKSLQDAIDDCVAIIAVLSPAYVNSSYCQSELARADRQKLPIIPVLIESIPPKDWPLIIERYQYIDFTNRRLTQVYETQLARLVKYIENQFAGQKDTVPEPRMRYVLNLIAQLNDVKQAYVDPSDDDEIWHNPTEPRAWLLENGIDVLDRPDDYHALTDIQTRTRVSLADPNDLLDFYPRMLVVGKPGSGKTAIVEHIALRMAYRWRETNGQTQLPLLVPIQKWDTGTELTHFIRQQWPFENDVMTSIASGEVVPLLDGLDETQNSKVDVLAAIGTWLEGELTPRYLILTSRLDAYPHMENLGLPILYAGDLTHQQIDTFIRQSLSSSLYNNMADRLAKDRLLAAIAVNPLVLQCLVNMLGNSPDGNLPDSFGVIMKQVVRAFWDRAKQRGLVTDIRLGQLEKALARLAFTMLRDSNGEGFSCKRAINLLGQKTLLEAAERIGYLTSNQNQVDFTLDQLKNYFGALWLTLKPTDLKYLQTPQLTSGTYAQLTECLCALAQDPQELFEKVIEHAPRAALYCMARGMPVFEDTLTTVVHAVVQDLSKLNDVAVDDIQDVATQLDNLKHSVILPLLLSLARDGEWAERQMAGQLLTAMHIPVIESVKESLAAELDDEVKVATIGGLRQLGIEALPTLLSLVRDQSEILRRNAIWAVGQLEDQAVVPVLVELLQAGDTPDILLVLDALHHLKDPASLPAIIDMLGNRSKQIRQAAAQGVYWFGEASVPILLSVLQYDTRLFIRLEVIAILADVNDELVTTTLLAATYDQDSRIRAAAIEALRDRKEAGVIKRLKECLADQSWIARSKRRICDIAASILQSMGTTDAIVAIQDWQFDDTNTVPVGEEPPGIDKKLERTNQSPEGSANTARQRLENSRENRIPPAVLEGLRSRDTDERKQSVRALQHVTPPLALLKLRQAIQDREAEVRLAAVEVASGFKHSASLPLLVEALNDEDTQVVTLAGKGIVSHGKRAIDSLQETYPVSRAFTRGIIVKTLAAIGGESAVPSLIQCLSEKTTHKAFKKSIAEMAADALEAIGTADAIRAVRKWQTKNNTPDPMLDVNHALNKQDEIFLRLIQTIRDDDWGEREEAFKALREYVKQLEDEHRSNVRRRLIYLLDDSDWVMRWCSIEALALTGDHDTAKKLIPHLKEENWMIRVATIRALVEIDDAHAAMPILDQLSDPHHVVREAAIEALGHFASPTAVPALSQFLKESDPFLRLAATEALAKIDAPMAIHGVLQSLKDEDKHVRWAAAYALRSTATAHHISHLVEALTDTAKPYWEDIRICDLVADALENIGTPLAKEAVQTWKKSEATQSGAP